MRRGGRHDHRRARRGRGEDQPDVHAVPARRARAVPRREARLRSTRAAQSGQGGADACALRRVRAHACAPRRAAASGARALLTLSALQEEIRAAAARAAPLRLRGGGSKDFYGNEPHGELLDVRRYAGIVDYEPSELVLTACGGTALAEVEAALADKGQCLPFEPPHFGAATLGGCIAAGLSGPRRAAAGALRDFVLGVKLVDGRGRVLEFGGRVMKNVAGYDVSRLLAGSLGTLGVIAEVSMKVLPQPPAERTLRFELDEATALDVMHRWAAEPLAITANAWHDGALYVRLAGSAAAVQAATPRLGGSEVDDS